MVKKEMVSVVRVAVRLDIGKRVVRAGADRTDKEGMNLRFKHSAILN